MTSFRNEYGGEMADVFARRQRADATFALPILWISALLETLWNTAAVHADVLRQDLRYSFFPGRA
jgi:hypothetical protein